MDICQTVADALAAEENSKQELHRSIRLRGQARKAIHNRAQELAAEKTTAGKRFASDEIFDGDDETVVAEWLDDTNRLRCVVVTPHDLKSYAFYSNRPSGMAQSIHRLVGMAPQHFEEHFRPLMKSDRT